MNVRYAAHCSYRIRYHMVFVFKYHKDLMSESKEFRGSYICHQDNTDDSLRYFSSKLIKEIIGSHIFNIAKQQWKAKFRLKHQQILNSYKVGNTDFIGKFILAS